MSTSIEDLCTLLLSSSTRVRLYGPSHRLAVEALEELEAGLEEMFEEDPSIRLAISGEEILYRDRRLEASSGPAWALVGRLAERGVGLLDIQQGVTRDEMVGFLVQMADAEVQVVRASPHIKIGTAEIELEPVTLDREQDRVRNWSGTRSDEVIEEARQLVRATGHLQEHYEVRARDFREIALSLLARFSQQDNLFMNLGEVRDHSLFTYIHTCNVASHAVGFSLALGAPGETALEIGVAALLHDVGKGFVPLEILDKPGKLTKEEWTVIRAHPVEGARFLVKQPEVDHLAVVVAYEHHMHFAGDGGYPRSRKRPSVQSQMVAIADAFDALFGKRSYHRRYDVMEALEILQSDAGKVYDPVLLDSFCRYVTINIDEHDWTA